MSDIYTRNNQCKMDDENVKLNSQDNFKTFFQAGIKAIKDNSLKS